MATTSHTTESVWPTEYIFVRVHIMLNTLMRITCNAQVKQARVSPKINFNKYRKTPNKRPWAFAGSVGLKRTFYPSSGFLRNENPTILS